MLTALGSLGALPDRRAPRTLRALELPVSSTSSSGAPVSLHKLLSPDLDSAVLNALAAHHGSLHLFMWGDSTMQRQQEVLASLVMRNATFWPRSHFTIPDLSVPVALPAPLDLGGTRPVQCTSVDVTTRWARLGAADFALTTAICKQGLLSIAMAPRVLELLAAKPGLPDPTLLYIGGGGLHHTHDETLSRDARRNACGCVRDWASIRPFVDGSFEERLEYGLRALESAYPKASLAYFNTHWLCVPKVRPANPTLRAAACATATHSDLLPAVVPVAKW